MNPLYAPEPITSAFFVPPTTHNMIGARVHYRFMETCRRLTTEGIVLDISVHPRGIVWVFIEPLDDTKTARWYIAGDVIVSYVWGVRESEPCARCYGSSVIAWRGCLYPCPECCKIDGLS